MEALRRMLSVDGDGLEGFIIPGNFSDNTWVHLLSHGFPRNPDRILDRLGRGIAMRFDANTVNPQQGLPAVFVRAGAAFDGRESRACEHTTRESHRVFFDFAPQP